MFLYDFFMFLFMVFVTFGLADRGDITKAFLALFMTILWMAVKALEYTLLRDEPPMRKK